MSIQKYISPFIQSHFPEFYREYGPNFIAFVQAYYEWLESAGNPINQARSLYEYNNIDSTLNTFIKYFKNKYMLSIPDMIAADKRLLTKYIIDLYKSKGSLRAYELLFRILFNEDIKIYVPGNDLFKLSNNRYVRPRYIEVTGNEYLNELVGKTIYNSSLKASATVENYYVKLVNRKTINVLVLSDISGSFNYGDRVISYDLYVDESGKMIGQFEYNNLSEEDRQNFSYAIDIENAPYVVGSLSSLGIVNGGSNFSVGELLNVEGDGIGGVARVAAVRNENGKISFKLLNGGSGFSTNAIISVSGGGGTGASFKIGGLINKEVLRINTDVIDDFYNTQLEKTSSGCNVEITGVSGTFYSGDQITSTSNTTILILDVVKLEDNVLANNECLTNTAIGLTAGQLVVYRSDGDSLYTRGSGINNANLTSGTILISNTSGTVVRVNTVLPTQNVYGNGVATFVNSSVITINQDFGYFVPGTSIVSGNTGATATVSKVLRNTDWSFAAATLERKNLDEKIGLTLSTYDIEVGTIYYIDSFNPGSGYSSSPTVTIIEPDVYNLRIPDRGGYKGYNAVVSATAATATGVVTAADIFDSGFGYSGDIYLTMSSSSNAENLSVVTGTSVVDSIGISSGYFTSSSGFLSDTQTVIDSNYWQAESYDIVATRMLSSYEKFVRDIVHPAGIALFGSFRVLSEVNNDTIAPAPDGFSLNPV